MSEYYKKLCIFCLRFNKLEIQANCSATYMCTELQKIFSMIGVLHTYKEKNHILKEKLSYLSWKVELGLSNDL